MRGAGRSCPTREGWRRSEIGCLKDNSSFFGAFPTAAPDRLRHKGYKIWIAASEYQLRPGATGRFKQDRKTLHGTAAQRGAYKPVANGGIVAMEHSAMGSNQRLTGGAWGQAAAAVGTKFKQRGVPVSFGPLLQSIP